MKAFLKDLFSYKGRWNRLKFWIYPLAIQLPIIVILLGGISTVSLQGYQEQAIEAKAKAIEQQLETITVAWLEQDTSELEMELEKTKQMLTETPGAPGGMSSILMVVLGILYIITFYVSIVTYIKRFHDLWKSGWYTLIMFIPFISILGIIWLGFFKWTSGPNKYGPDPLAWTTVEAPAWEL